MNRPILAAALAALAVLGHADPTPPPPPPTPTPVPTICHSGECFPAAARIGASEVPLSGIGTLTYLGLRVYTAALYAEPAPAGIEDALGAAPLRLVLRYHRRISRGDIDRSVDKALAGNPEVDLESVAGQLAAMRRLHRDVGPGDSYELTHQPGTGLSVRFNGTDLGTIPGDEFAAAYLGIWLSRRPLSETLKEKLTTGVRQPGRTPPDPARHPQSK